MRRIMTIIMCLLLTVPALAQQVIIAKKKSGGGAVAVTDNFDRTDANPIGGNWSVPTGGAALKILSNVVTGTVDETTDNLSYWNADTFANDQYSQAVITGDNVGVAVRMATGALTYYAFIHTTGDQFEVHEVTTGTWAKLGDTYAETYTPGDTIKLTISGSTLTPYLNGSALATRSDSSISSGSAGIVIATPFPTSQTINNWAGGDL